MKCGRCGRGPLAPEGTPGVALADQHGGRGLCRPCYGRAYTDGTLADHERTTWPAAELVAEAELVRARQGGTWREVAGFLGVSLAALERAQVRERARTRASVSRRQHATVNA